MASFFICSRFNLFIKSFLAKIIAKNLKQTLSFLTLAIRRRNSLCNEKIVARYFVFLPYTLKINN